MIHAREDRGLFDGRRTDITNRDGLDVGVSCATVVDGRRRRGGWLVLIWWSGRGQVTLILDSVLFLSDNNDDGWGSVYSWGNRTCTYLFLLYLYGELWTRMTGSGDAEE